MRSAIMAVSLAMLSLPSLALAAGGEKQPGLIDINYSSIIWTIVIFLILLAILYPTAWKGVLAGLKQREQGIRDDIEAAKRARDEAAAMLKQYEVKLATAQDQVQQMLTKAHADAEALAANLKQQAQHEMDDLRARTGRDIEASKRQAIAEIYREAAEIATSVAEKILRRNLNVEDQRQLVDSSLQELQQTKPSQN